MKNLLKLWIEEPDTPHIVKLAMKRMHDRFSKPPEPIMSQEKFDKLPTFERNLLFCNMPGCGKMVSTHGLLCVEHKLQMDKEYEKENGNE